MADGSSYGSGRNALLEKISELPSIERVVDFGCGGGANGIGLRKVLPGVRQIVGVDVWPPTIARRLEDNPKIYDEILRWDFSGLVTDSKPLIERGGAWDLWVFGDSLEHVALDVALKIMSWKNAGPLTVRYIAARFPCGEYPQGAAGGNPAEVHRWSWYDGLMDRVDNDILWKISAVSQALSVKRGIQEVYEGRVDDMVYRLNPKRYIANLLIRVR